MRLSLSLNFRGKATGLIKGCWLNEQCSVVLWEVFKHLIPWSHYVNWVMSLLYKGKMN